MAHEPPDIFPPGDAPSTCTPVSKTQQDLLDLFDRILPAGYLLPLKNQIGPGYELLQMYAKVFERVSLAIGRVECGMLILSSFAGLKATGNVEFFRTNTSATLIQSVTSSVTFSAPVSGTQTISGLSGMTAASVGRYLVVSGAANGGNNGTFLITGFVSATSVTVANSLGVAEGPTANVAWIEGVGVILLKGTIVSTSIGGRRFLTAADATLFPTDLAVTAPVEAEAVGWEWNVPGKVVFPDGEEVPGEIDTIDLPIQDPPFSDPSIRVRQLVSTAGGQAAMLDQLGLDRGLTRRAGEPDRTYRARIRALPDTVSLDAIKRALTNLLLPITVAFSIIETFEFSYQTCWFEFGDAATDPNEVATIPQVFGFDPNTFVWDDPRPLVPFRNRWLDENEHRGAFIAVIPELAAFADVGMAWDDTASTLAAHMTENGKRAHNAYDVPLSANPSILQGGYDGFDLSKAAVYKNIFDTLQAIKAGGIAAIVEREGE